MNDGYDYREQVGEEIEGWSLAGYLGTRYPHSAESLWRERIKAGQVLVDGRVAEPGSRVRPGQILLWRRPPWEEPPAPLSFAVLYRDPHLLAVLKPAGLPTLPGGGYLQHTLLTLVRRRYPEASPVHRIGRATTGLVLCALSGRVAASLATMWRGEVRKIYRALVAGAPPLDRFSVEAAIGRVPRGSTGFEVHAASPAGKRALSHVRVLERREAASVVEVEIVTGRPHQARIHLAAAGYPLCGDPLYGPGGHPLPGTNALPGEGGFHLHSHRLWLEHPISRWSLRLEAPVPRALKVSGDPI